MANKDSTIKFTPMRADEMARLFDSAHSVIPSGPYCYGAKGPCPYWGMSEDQENQDNGYCALLKQGDWEHDGIALLWDQCKACGVNEDLAGDIA